MKSRVLPYSTKRIRLFLIALLPYFGLFCASLYASEPKEAPATWSGVDETVIEKYAEAAGRSAREPLINTDQGDLLLFVFLLAGALGGFIAGYAYRSLSPKKPTLPLAILLGSLACVNPCHAQEGHVEQHAPHQHIHPPSEEPLSYEVILGINSMDIWNGMVGYDHPFAHVAPRIAYDQETLGTFAMGADFLYPMGSPRPSKCGGLSEMDVALSWDRSFGPVNLQLGTTYYSIMPDHRDDLYEGFVGLRYENEIVVPYLVGYYDFNQTDGTYFKGGLCRTFKLMERLSADIDLCCGYGLPAYNRGYFASNHATFTDATAQLILQYDVTSNLYIGGTAAFTMLLDNAIRNSQFVNDTYGTVDNFWFGLHVGVHF
jgi:hypothetical protein